MSKILNMADRLQHKKQNEQAKLHRQKLEALQKVAQCSACRFKCALCGSTLGNPRGSRADHTSSADFVFCESCRAEYEDYLEMAKGQKKSEIFWHNTEWMELWSTWLSHQQAIRRFRECAAFLKICRALNLPGKGGGK